MTIFYLWSRLWNGWWLFDGDTVGLAALGSSYRLGPVLPHIHLIFGQCVPYDKLKSKCKKYNITLWSQVKCVCSDPLRSRFDMQEIQWQKAGERWKYIVVGRKNIQCRIAMHAWQLYKEGGRQKKQVGWISDPNAVLRKFQLDQWATVPVQVVGVGLAFHKNDTGVHAM